MILARVVRAAAILAAIAAAIDPAVTTTRRVPVPVAIRTGQVSNAEQAAAVRERASRVKARLTQELGAAVDFNSADAPAAIVLVADSARDDDVRPAVSVSTVAGRELSGPHVRILRVRSPRETVAGWAARVDVIVHARAANGRAVRAALVQHGIELDSAQRTVEGDDSVLEIPLTFVPPTAGVHEVRVSVAPADGERVAADHDVDLRISTTARPLRVAVYDRRPSWASAFVRRALEENAAFEVSALVRASKGLDVRAGTPPSSLTAASLDPFHVVLIGAPEELDEREVSALHAFAAERGGSVVFLPDSRPRGPYVRALGAGAFDELLLEHAVRVGTPDALELRASELAVPHTAREGAIPIGTVQQGEAERAVVFSVPAGAGQMIFSGALDAWRFRAERDHSFAAFWRATVGSAAMASRDVVEAEVDPGVARPGEWVRVRASLRPSVMERRADALEAPPMGAELVDGRGMLTPVRLWPLPETGVYEGGFEAPAEGPYEVRVTARTQISAGDVLIVRGDAARPVVGDGRALQALSSATGGVFVREDDIGRLSAYVRALPSPLQSVRRHILRSPWWVVAFVALLAAEWTMRRVRGLR